MQKMSVDDAIQRLDPDHPEYDSNLDFVFIEHGMTHEKLESLAGVLAKNTSLTALKLDGREIGDDGVKLIAKTLETNSTLEYLGLRNNHLSSEGAQALAEMLKKNRSLDVIDLEFNNIGDKGVEYFADALQNNSTLTELGLAHNEVGDEGAIALAKALRMNKALTALSLAANNVDYDGAKALVDMLAKNSTLKVIALIQNKFGKQGALLFAEALQAGNVHQGLFVNLSSHPTEVGPELDIYYHAQPQIDEALQSAKCPDGVKFKVANRILAANRTHHLLALQQCQSKLNEENDDCHLKHLPQDLLNYIYWLAFPYSSKDKDIPQILLTLNKRFSSEPKEQSLLENNHPATSFKEEIQKPDDLLFNDDVEEYKMASFLESRNTGISTPTQPEDSGKSKSEVDSTRHSESAPVRISGHWASTFSCTEEIPLLREPAQQKRGQSSQESCWNVCCNIL